MGIGIDLNEILGFDMKVNKAEFGIEEREE